MNPSSSRRAMSRGRKRAFRIIQKTWAAETTLKENVKNSRNRQIELSRTFIDNVRNTLKQIRNSS